MAGERGLAEQVRTGLEQQTSGTGPTLVALSKKEAVDPLDVVTYKKSAKQHVREFACIFAIICFGIAGVQLYNANPAAHPDFWIAFGSLWLVGGYALPRLMLPLWKGWMKFAMALGMVMSTIIVTIAWFLMFFPVGIVFKIIGKRVMDLSFKAPVDTYWEVRDEKLSDFKMLERQF